MTKTKGFISFNVAAKWKRKLLGVAPKERYEAYSIYVLVDFVTPSDSDHYQQACIGMHPSLIDLLQLMKRFWLHN